MVVVIYKVGSIKPVMRKRPLTYHQFTFLVQLQILPQLVFQVLRNLASMVGARENITHQRHAVRWRNSYSGTEFLTQLVSKDVATTWSNLAVATVFSHIQLLRLVGVWFDEATSAGGRIYTQKPDQIRAEPR